VAHQGSDRLRLRERLEHAIHEILAMTIFPEPAQWDVTNKVWAPYMDGERNGLVATFYPPDNMKRPNGPHLRWLPFGRLQHSDQTSVGVERRLRALPWSGERAMWSILRAATP